MGVIRQIACSGIIWSLCGCMGIMFSWPSSTIRLFESANTPLHRPMTETELSLFGSMASIGAMIGTPIFGLLLDRIGRKNSAIANALLRMLAWMMIAVNSRVEVLLAAVFISGLSGTVFLVAPVYVGEICQESIRGAMCSGSMVMYAAGILVSYILGGLLEYHVMVYTYLSLSAVVTASLVFLKESPTHLMAKGRDKEAAETIAFYRNVKPDTNEVLQELNVIRKTLNPDMENVTSEEEKQLKPEAEIKEKISTWGFIKKSRSTRRAIFVTFILTTMAIFQGFAAIHVYARPIFENAVSSMSANVASILMAVIGIVAGVIASILTEVAGRRPLMIYSSFATGAACFFLGLQLQFQFGSDWLVVVAIYFYAIMFTFGAATVPFVILAEVFLPEVKSLFSMIVVEWTWVCVSIILLLFNTFEKAFGLGPIFYIYGVMSVACAVFSIFYLPETKGLTVDAIQDVLVKKQKNKTEDA